MPFVDTGSKEDKINLSDEEFYRKHHVSKDGFSYGYPIHELVPQEVEVKEERNWKDVFAADFMSNPLVVYGQLYFATPKEDADPDFRLTEENTRGYERDLGVLAMANNEFQLNFVKEILDEKYRNEQVIEDSNGLSWFGGKALGLALDPAFFGAGKAVSVASGIAKGFSTYNKVKNFAGKYVADVFGKDFAKTAGGTMLYRAGIGAASGAAVGGVYSGIEALSDDVGMSDVFRNMATFAVLSSVFGSVVGANEAREMSLMRKKADKLIEEITKKGTTEIVVTSEEFEKFRNNPKLVDARIKKAWGFENFSADPSMAGFLSNSPTMKAAMSFLSDVPVKIVDGKTGELMTFTPSIESTVAPIVGQYLRKSLENLDEYYSKWVAEKGGNELMAKLNIKLWKGGARYQEFLSEWLRECYTPGTSSSEAIKELVQKNFKEIITPISDIGQKADVFGYKRAKDFELNQKKAELEKQNTALNKQKKTKEKELSLLEKPEPQTIIKDTVNINNVSSKTSKAVEGFFDELDKSAKLLSDLKIKAQKTIKKIEKNNLKNIDEDFKVLDRDSNDHVFNEIRFIKEHTQKEELQLFLYNALKSNNDLREFIESVTLDGIPYYKPRPANTRFSFRYMPEEHGSDIKRFYKNTNVYLGSQGKEYIDKNVVLDGLRNAVKEIEEEEKLLVKRIELFKKTQQKATVKNLTQHEVAKPSQDFELKTKELEAINKEIEKNNKEIEETDKAIEENNNKVYTHEDFKKLIEGELYFPRMYDTMKIAMHRDAAVADIKEGMWSISELRDLRNTPENQLTTKERKLLLKEDERLQEAADEAVSHILHEEDKAPAKNPIKTRSFEHERSLRFSTEYVKDWIIQDPEKILTNFVRTIPVDSKLLERFGTLNVNDVIGLIREDYKKLIDSAVSQEQKKALADKCNKDIDNFRCVWCRVRGITEYSSLDLTQHGIAFNHAANIISNLNVARLIGGTVISATSDLAQAMMTLGFKNFFKSYSSMFKKDFWKAFSGSEGVWLRAFDHFERTRSLGFYNQMIGDGFLSAVDNFTGRLANLAVKASFINKWDEFNKFVVGYVTQEGILKAGEKLSKGGKLVSKDLEFLSATGVTEENAVKMFEQFKKYGRVSEGGAWESGVGLWDNAKLQDIFRGGVRKIQNQAILTPTAGSVPLFFDRFGSLGKMLFQFRRFSYSTYSKVLMPMLQKRDLEAFGGLTMMVSIGVMKAYLRALKGGYAISMSDAIKQSLQEAECISYMGDAFGIGNALIGANEENSKGNREFLRKAGGTGYDFVDTFARGIPGMFRLMTGFGGDLSYGQIHNIRKMLPLQNNILLFPLFDKFEAVSINKRGSKMAKKRLREKENAGFEPINIGY